MAEDFDVSFQHTLQRESWPLYGVGILFIALRQFARVYRLGFKKLQIDDYLMITAAAWYTILITCLNLITSGGGSNLFPIEDLPTLTEEDIREMIKGSKIVLVSEQAMLNVIYTIKACMLILYWRLTNGLKQQVLVQILSIYVAIGWVATELAFFLACRPFHGYWAVPPPSPQCATFEIYGYIQASFNLSSDLAMLAVVIPLLIKLQLPWSRRIALIIIFSLGSFVIAAAVCTNVSIWMDEYSSTYMLWYVRESSTAVYVSNIPLIWPLLVTGWGRCRKRVTATLRTGSTGTARTWMLSRLSKRSAGGSAIPVQESTRLSDAQPCSKVATQFMVATTTASRKEDGTIIEDEPLAGSEDRIGNPLY